jgi:hypothetical protein
VEEAAIKMRSNNPSDGSQQKRAYLRVFGKVVLAAGAVLFLLHKCALIPTSPYAAREFVMSRDYKYFRAILQLDELPSGFKIEKMFTLGAGFMPSPDGPADFLYQASVPADKYAALTREIAAKKTDVWEMSNHAKLPLYKYNTELGYYLVDAYATTHWGTTETVWVPDYYQVDTTGSTGIAYRTHIVADTRSSDSVALYVATRLPYDF